MDSPTATQPPVRKELSDDTEFGTAAIAAGAFTGATVGTVIPVVGTVFGATIGAGFGFIVGLTAKEVNDSKKAKYQALLDHDSGDESWIKSKIILIDNFHA